MEGVVDSPPLLAARRCLCLLSLGSVLRFLSKLRYHRKIAIVYRCRTSWRITGFVFKKSRIGTLCVRMQVGVALHTFCFSSQTGLLLCGFFSARQSQ